MISVEERLNSFRNFIILKELHNKINSRLSSSVNVFAFVWNSQRTFSCLCYCCCSSSRFLQILPELRNCKSVFLILNISHYGGSMQWVRLFPMHLCKNWYKNWYLYSIRPMATKFGKQVYSAELTQMNLFKQMLVT